MGPILGFLVVMILAVVFARMSAQERAKEAEPVKQIEASEIFGSLPVEEPSMPGSKPPTDGSPEDIAQTELWVKARGIAVRAAAVYTIAKEAKARDDHALWHEKGKEAKELYNEAVTLSVDWEAGLIEKYGDNDRRVKAITSELNGWFRLLEVLAKTTSR